MDEQPLARNRYRVELFRDSDGSRWHASVTDIMGCGAEADTAAAALAALPARIAHAEAEPGADRMGEQDPVILRLQGEELDEIVTTRRIHLERMSEWSWYLGVGDLQVWFAAPEGSSIEAWFEANDEAIRRETA